MSEESDTQATQQEGRTGARFLGRTWRNLREAWREIAASAQGLVGSAGGFRPDLPEPDLARLSARMHDCLEARGGEVSARARAAELGRTYLGLDPVGRQRFLVLLASEFGIDRRAVSAAAEKLGSAPDEDGRAAAERALRLALEAPRLRLLTQFNALPEGVKFLVELRADLIRLATDDRRLAAVEGDLKGLLAGWFDIGFLELNRITWDSPAALLEKLSLYEAVHEVRSWTDLKNRLDSDRRCFAFFHPRMPDEPLIFVEVALVSGLSDNIGALLDEHAPVGDPRAADTAIFYSISNAHKGLAGISFGGFLIKRVVDRLAAEFPRLKTFATLSPIPGFRPWLAERFAEGEPGMLAKGERKALAAAAEGHASKGALKQILSRHDWARSPALAAALKRPLMRLAVRYLLEAKRGDGGALDPVAHFHLRNGARIERLDWLADNSAKGLQQSAGMMVNYLYRLSEIEANHEAYAAEGRIAASSATTGLLK
ncbi:MAG: malonyl-CoA decarboxylase [Pseudomonadota bacterium]